MIIVEKWTSDRARPNDARTKGRSRSIERSYVDGISRIG